MHSDVLIVGAGSAGCVLAERLSADPGCLVTVLEAGPGPADPVVRSQVANARRLPIGTASLLVERFETSLTTDPPRPTTIVRGAVVGGSGAVNGGYFCRGLPSDFDRWQVPGWTWADVRDHFRAIENDLDFIGPEHGDSGPITLRRSGVLSDVSARFVQAAQQAGYDWIADLNGCTDSREVGDGVGAVPLNIVDGVRIGPGLAYLEPALTRPNLTLLTHTRAQVIRIEKAHAIAVDSVGPAGQHTFMAGQIVLCCGAIGSAHLLMLSGIGSGKTLPQAGIAVVASLPVGEYCTDHPEWVLSTNWTATVDAPVLEVMLSTVGNLEIRPYTAGFAAMVSDGAVARPDPPHIGVALMQPRSRGRITVASADPRVPLHIEHRYDSEPDDLAALQRGSELVRDMCAGTGVPAWSTSQHLCGSAPIGVDGDEHAVLDPRCRVRGIEGLWVVDGSALPAITSRGPHATIVMLAHRAAEFVRAG